MQIYVFLCLLMYASLPLLSVAIILAISGTNLWNTLGTIWTLNHTMLWSVCTDFMELTVYFEYERPKMKKNHSHRIHTNILCGGTNVSLTIIVLLHKLYFLWLPVDAIYFHLSKPHENVIIFTFLPVKCFLSFSRSQRAPFTWSHTHKQHRFDEQDKKAQLNR